MNPLHEALRAGHAKPRRHSAAARRVLVAGGGGALGAAVMERLLASRRVAQVAVLVTQPLNVALRGLVTLPHQALAEAPRRTPVEDLAVIVFDRDRHANGREAAFLRPDPAALAVLAGQLRQRGVRDLLVVMPHAPATLPDALKRGLANLDEHAVAVLGFDHLVIVRSAHASAAVRAVSAPQRVANWVLSQLHLMIPQRDKPVRAGKVAEFCVQLAMRLHDSPNGTRIVPPEVVWEAAHAPDMERFASEWLRG